VESRQTNELVDRIRLKRHRIARAAGLPEFLDGAARHARQHPLVWIGGGVVVGALSARLLIPGVFRLSRGVARHWLHSTVQRGIVGLAHGAFWSMWPPDVPGEVDAEWEDAPTDGDNAPLQATGGAIEPLRSS
jgi:hypothetical protein